MWLNLEKTQNLLEERGWSEVMFARKLNLDYSYVYRVLRGQRGVGKKFLKGLLKLCERESLNFKEFIFLEDRCDKIKQRASDDDKKHYR